jgi:hypothetical protein
MALRNTRTWNILVELLDFQPVILYHTPVSLCEKPGQYYWRFLYFKRPTGSGARLLCCSIDDGNNFPRSKTAITGTWYLRLVPKSVLEALPSLLRMSLWHAEEHPYPHLYNFMSQWWSVDPVSCNQDALRGSQNLVITTLHVYKIYQYIITFLHSKNNFSNSFIILFVWKWKSNSPFQKEFLC